LEKTLYDKAKEKYKHALKKGEADDETDQHANDYLYPILSRMGLAQKQHNLEYKDALLVRNEALSKLKERILARAEIIQKRLEEEKENLFREENKAKKGTMRADEEKDFDERIQKLRFKIEILDQRAARFETQVLEKYEELDNKLNNDPRLEILHKGKRDH
jgi:putative cell wall-binding protein